MHLLNVETYSLEEYFEPDIPPYAILSHRWEQEEVLYSDINTETSRNKIGWNKVQLTCDQARKDQLAYVWIDTCCIDKKSSAELSEAINSMFRWYQNSSVCYAYLSDVTSPHPMFMNNAIAWFDRGWTLQELIAPQRVVFYGRTWTRLGDRIDLSYQISHKTRIPPTILSRVDNIETVLLRFTAAQKLSWAAGRRTTRLEDRAYSLLGLFGLTMPLLYGEGSQAFIRLQEEILRTGTDLSILAWSQKSGPDQTSLENLLAESPDSFQGCEDIVYAFSSPYTPTGDTDFVMTNRGLHIDHPPIVASGDARSRIALSLGCRRSDDVSGVLALKLRLPLSDNLIVASQTSKGRVCHLGWPSDNPDQDARIVRARFFQPLLLYDWQAITVPKHHVHQASISRPAFDAPHHYLWFLLPDDDEVSWTVLDLWPRGNDPWDRETKACYLGSATDQSLKFAAIKVGSGIREAFIMFLKYNFDTLEFGLSVFPAWYPLLGAVNAAVSAAADEVSLRYGATEATLNLSPQCSVKVVRQDIQPPGHTIRQLKITVARSAPARRSGPLKDGRDFHSFRNSGQSRFSEVETIQKGWQALIR